MRILSLVCLAGIVGAMRHRHRRSRSERKSTAKVLTPADGDEYVRALSTINRFCPVRCASEIVQPANTKELAGWMRANIGRPFTLKGGGHSYGCQSVPKDGEAMIHTGQLKDARVFRRPDGTAYLRAGTGLTFDEVVPRLAKMGYSMPHGECLTVGVGGWNFNVGQHPELKNFDNEWGYNGSAFLTKATFVDYDGTIFTVDRTGITLVELGNISRIAWELKALNTKTAAAAMWAGQAIMNEIDIVAVSNIMRVFKAYGASLAIATEIEVELVPKPEPGFFGVVYGVNDILDERDGRGKKLMQDIVDVVINSGADPRIDCGIFYADGYFPGTLEGALALKCADWSSRSGASLRTVVPAGYRQFAPKKSGFLFWSRDSYGKGWVPAWHAEKVPGFQQAGGAEKYRDYIRSLDRGDKYGPNPCDSCSSELMFMLKPVRNAHIMFDNLCSASRDNQNECSAFVLRIKEEFLGEREILYKQNLPSCATNRKWKGQVAEYMSGAYLIAQALKRDWDHRGVVDFWLGVGHEGNGGSCEATHTQAVGATCQQNGITPEDLVEAELDYVRGKCPAFESYENFDDQNNKCSDYIYDVATPLPLTIL